MSPTDTEQEVSTISLQRTPSLFTVINGPQLEARDVAVDR